MSRRHIWIDRDRVYLLGINDGRSIQVHGMISRIGPDDVVHHPGDMDEALEDVWTICAQQVNDSWPLLYSAIVDCADCGEALRRRGQAIAMSPALAHCYEERFMGAQSGATIAEPGYHDLRQVHLDLGSHPEVPGSDLRHPSQGDRL